MKSIYDTEAELRLLAGSLNSVNWLNEMMAQLKAENFASSESREIFAVIQSLYDKDIAVNFESVYPRALEKNLRLEPLVSLLTLPTGGYLASEFINQIKDSYYKRSIVDIAHTYTKEAARTDLSADEILRSLEEKLFSLTSSSSSQVLRNISSILNDPIPFTDVLQKRQENYAQGISSFEGFPTHFIDLDKYLKGLTKGHFTLIGARPGVGKTSMALNLIENLCFKTKIPVLFFSLEMPAREILEKLLAQTSEVPYQKISNGSLGGPEYQNVYVTAKAWEKKTLIIDDQPSLGIDQVKSRALRAKRTHNIQAIFIDYVQLITSKKGQEARHLEIGDISRRLKEIAKELNVPVIALAQLNREVEKRQDKTPYVSDLRESGSLEADADEIVLLDRPEMYNHNEKPGLMQVHIAKNRFGPTGHFSLVFLKECGKLKDYTPIVPNR